MTQKRRGIIFLLNKRIHPGILSILLAIFFWGSLTSINKLNQQTVAQLRDVNKTAGGSLISSKKAVASNAGHEVNKNDQPKNQSSNNPPKVNSYDTNILAYQAPPVPSQPTAPSSAPQNNPPAQPPAPQSPPEQPPATPNICVLGICIL